MCLFCAKNVTCGTDIVVCEVCAHQHTCACNRIVDTLTEGCCVSCFSKYYAKCSDCGEYHKKDDSVETGDKWYCADCGEDYFCTSCGSGYETSEGLDGHYYCADCFWERFSICEDCGETIWTDESYYSELGGCTLCSDCYNRAYFTCSECGCEYEVCDRCSDGCCSECSDECDHSECPGNPIISDTFYRVNSKRWFGIEVETDRGDYNDAPESWGVKRDGSISGMELVSPIMSGDAGLESIEEMYSNVDPEFDYRCGIHVHINVRDLTDEQRFSVIKAFAASKDRWFNYVDPDRHTNTYCDVDLPTPGNDYNAYMRNYPNTRYCWCNLKSIMTHGTIEIRLLEGTDDVKKVIDWVVMLLEFVESVLVVEEMLV